MLAGISSQIGGLIGGVRKSSQSGAEEQPAGETPSVGDGKANNAAATSAKNAESPEGNAAGSTEANNHGAAATASSVLGSVRSHIPSWLSGGRFLGKEEPGEGGTAAGEEASASASPAPASAEPSKKSHDEKGRISPEGGSDASSATGGADSEKHISELEAEGSETTVDRVKSFGTYLFSSIKGAGQKLKETNILGEFQKEHDSFLKGKGKDGDALVPWVGHPKEEELKAEILSLSTDRRNFVRSPPTSVAFPWDYEEMLPIAKAILKEDDNLEKMRYDLVPKIINEETFWRNYFYRVSLLKESLSGDEPKKKHDSVDTEEEDAALEKELNEELKSFEVVDGSEGRKLGSNTSAIDDKEIDSMLDLK